MGFWAAAIPAAAGIASSALSAMSGSGNIKKQIAWERERAQNAHQWEVQDLKAAGLNPILSAGGQGATTGGISTPMPDYSGIASAGQAIGNMIQEQQRIKNETDATAAGVKRTKAEEMNIWQDTFNKMREEGLIDAKKQREYTESMLNTGKTELVYYELKKEAAIIEQEIETLKAQLKAAKNEAEKNEIQSKIDKKTAWVEKITGIIGQVIGMGTSIGKTKAALNSASAAQSRATAALIAL